MLETGTASTSPLRAADRVAVNHLRLSIARLPIGMAGRTYARNSVALLLQKHRSTYYPHPGGKSSIPNSPVAIRTSAGQTPHLPILPHRRDQRYLQHIPTTPATQIIGRSAGRPTRESLGKFPKDQPQWTPHVRTALQSELPLAMLGRVAAQNSIVYHNNIPLYIKRTAGPSPSSATPSPERLGREMPSVRRSLKMPTHLIGALPSGSGAIARQSMPTPRDTINPGSTRQQRTSAPVVINPPRAVAATQQVGDLSSPNRSIGTVPDEKNALSEYNDTTVVHLDGQVLGQWVLEHIERALTRAPTTANFATNHGIPAWSGQPPLF